MPFLSWRLKVWPIKPNPDLALWLVWVQSEFIALFEKWSVKLHKCATHPYQYQKQIVLFLGGIIAIDVDTKNNCTLGKLVVDGNSK